MHYKELNLPNDPIKNFDELIGYKKEKIWTYCTDDVDHYINEDLLAVFDSIGLRPRIIACFGMLNQKFARSTIHNDIGWIDNTWQSLPFGINWELTPSDMTFCWWDTSGYEKILPDDTTPKVDVWGIKYNNGKHFSDNTGYKCLDTFKPKYKIPFLARTDVPHQVEYKTEADTRIAVSIRFDNKDIPTWEDAVKKFEPFFFSE